MDQTLATSAKAILFPLKTFFFSFLKGSLAHWDVETWHWDLRNQNSFSVFIPEAAAYIKLFIKTKT